MELYEAIHSRRDVRHFRPDPLPETALGRILEAAHHAGSVGFMQPWSFLLVRSLATRRRIAAHFERENELAAQVYQDERAALYRSLKLAGITDSPLNIAVTCDRSRGGPHVLGRRTMPETDLFSTCCAVQNLWLAARAEGIGVGWVSIIEPEAVKAELGIPQDLVLVAYLCVGYPVAFAPEPMLETAGWARRLPLRDVVYDGAWGAPWREPEG